MNETPLKLWKINDGGETHMVIANDSDEALKLAAPALGVELAELMDGEPTVELADYSKPCVVRCDDEHTARKLAKQSRLAHVNIEVVLPPASWRELPPGLVSTTCY